MGEPATLQVRRAVRAALARLPEPARSAPLLVGCSGGADSLALAYAAAAERPGRVCVAVVDHGLQEGSAERSAELAARLSAAGLRASVHRVTVDGEGGTEAAARRARYAALRAARTDPASPVLLGHTLDDQAETVLLGLGRGSGPRSMAGMREWDEPWLRPLLGVRRAVTRAACAGLPVWEDPHNLDPRFTRVRLRREVLPLLEDVLSSGVAEALARTAAQLREDSDALDVWAAQVRTAAERPDDTAAEPLKGTAADRPVGNVAGRGGTAAGRPESAVGGRPESTAAGRPGSIAAERPGNAAAEGPEGAAAEGPGNAAVERPDVGGATLTEPATRSPEFRDSRGGERSGPGGDEPSLAVSPLHEVPPAVRRRVLRDWLLANGVTALTDAHLRAADDLVGAWRGQGGPALPGGLDLVRVHGRLVVRPRFQR